MKSGQKVDLVRLESGKNQPYRRRLAEIDGRATPLPGTHNPISPESKNLILLFSRQAEKISTILSATTDNQGFAQRYTRVMAGNANSNLPPEVRNSASLSMIPWRKCQGRTKKTSGCIARASCSGIMGIWVPGVTHPNLSGFTSAMNGSSRAVMPQYCKATFPLVEAP